MHLEIYRNSAKKFCGCFAWYFVELYDQNKLMLWCHWCVTDKTRQSSPRTFSISSLLSVTNILYLPQAFVLVPTGLFYCLKVLLFLSLCLFSLEHERQDICSGSVNYQMSFCQSGWRNTASNELMRASKTEWLCLRSVLHKETSLIKFVTL